MNRILDFLIKMIDLKYNSFNQVTKKKKWKSLTIVATKDRTVLKKAQEKFQ
jgi:hypothetical protein